MSKNLFDSETAQQIIDRVQKLQPTSKARWGSMNATEMLLHANMCNEEIFSGAQPAGKTTYKQYLLRILALYIAPKFKKNIKGDGLKETTGKIDAASFKMQQQQFMQLIRRFPQHKDPVKLTHIAFGNISTNEWGIAAYKHMDHHLRQFGV